MDNPNFYPQPNHETILSSDNIIELCPEELENKFHNIRFMESISVLTEEIKLMEKISELYKKSKDDNDTFEVFDNKKVQCEKRIELLTRKIEDGIMKISEYCQLVLKTIKYQKELLKRVDSDIKLKNKEFTKKRVNDRLNILEKEYDELKEVIKKQQEEVNDKEDEKEEKKSISPMTAIIEDRLEDYKNALKYFEDNNMSDEQITKTNKIIRIFELSIKKINEGKSKEIDIDKLPKEINYEFIYGMTTKERNEKFMEILKDLKKKETEDKEKLNTVTNEMKGLSTNKIKKEMANIRSILDNLKEHVKQDEFNSKVYTEAFKNKWCPCPIVEEIEREFEVPVSSKNIAENTLILIVDGINGIKCNKFNVSLVCKYDSRNTFNQELKGNKNQLEKYETSIKLDKTGMKYLWKKNLIVTLQEYIQTTKCFCCTSTSKQKQDIGYLEISFKDFKNCSSIEKEFEFSSMNKKSKIGISIKIGLNIREPLVEKEYKIEKKMTREIMKVFQPFKGDPIENYDTPSSMNILNDGKFIKKKTNQSKNSTSRSNANINKPNLNKNPTMSQKQPQTKPKLNIEYTNEDFKAEELIDPCCPDIIVTAKSLDYEIKKLDEKIAKIEGRTPKELRDKRNKMVCKKQILENMLGDQINPQQYAAIVKDSIDHHRKLQKYFQDKNEIDKQKIVTERINVLVSEMNEIINLLKGQLQK